MNSLGMAILIVVIGQVAYHTLARGNAPGGSIFALVCVAYGSALVATTSAGLISGQIDSRQFPLALVVRGAALGLSVTLVELGYVYAYRRGLSLGTGPLSVLALTTIALIPIGVLAYREQISLRVLAGVALAACGVWLMRP